MISNPLFQKHFLNEQHVLYSGKLPESLWVSEELFQDLWNLHPATFPEIKMHGKTVAIPRWQVAYGRSYWFSGQWSPALPIPPLFQNHLQWLQENVDNRLNGLLVNWYDGQKGHYIGKHRDSTQGIISNSPIVTLSLGESRLLRMRPWKEKGFLDFEALDGSIYIIPQETNRHWTHEIPPQKHKVGKRISMTCRAFEEEA